MVTTTTIGDFDADALDELIGELRDFIAKIERPRLGDTGWREAMGIRAEQLAGRLAEAKGQLGAAPAATVEAFGALADRLRATAEVLADHESVAALRDRCAALSRSYEELLLELKRRRAVRHAGLMRTRQLKPRNLVRNAFHASMALTAVSLYHLVLTQAQALWVLGTVFAVFGTLEVTRRFSDRWNDFLVDKVFGAISRPSERYRINSATIYLVALILIAALFPKAAVEAAILVLGFGDPAASLVGKRWGRRKLLHDKSLAGSLGFVAAAAASVAVFLALAYPELGALGIAGRALLMGFVGAAVELVSHRVDDNFSIPVVCAAVGALVF